MDTEDDRTPGDDAEDQAADLSAALNELLASGGGGQEAAPEPAPEEPSEAAAPADEPGGGGADSEGLDLSALESAVAELGLDVGDDADDAADEPPAAAGDDASEPSDEGTRMFSLEADSATEPSAQEPAGRPAPGLDLTELPPPSTPAAPVERDMPPLGQATADDLFGPLDDDDDPGLPSTWEDSPEAEDSAPPADELAMPAPSPEASPVDVAEPEPEPEPVRLPAPEAPPAPAEPDPAMDDVVAFTAHGGPLSGGVRDKAKRLFKR